TPSNGGSYLFAYGLEWVPVEISFVEPTKPLICLIIDDGGYQKGEALEHLYGFKVPVTVSIIPDVEFSKSLAEEFPDHGVEVMCHMPMEGHEKGAVGGNYKALLKKGMDPAVAKKDVEEALEDLPHCRGLNNHMGSVATEDPELIQGVCEALKSQGLFIIDSRTTAKSVVKKIALKTGVPVASRNIFLDNIETPAAILKQLGQAAAYAKKHGLVVAIGHFKLVTLKTLEDAVSQLRDQGFQFVYASEVVKDE
ncbi:MAG TPA: divergent polysaccharide deacetylase family protein, partial [bacterium]|nr:divergent polysaccharide deacetylase family protein [bacterium]